ncbi:MAG: type II toxin-antitoxin system HicA family toxin [Deltaproteobacteria bacterium]|nr:type II toxin-antitoxin system HicA family toxin [Deltaproteobacteria bacterium]
MWYNEVTDRYTILQNHSGDMPEGTLRAILREAGISPNDFLKKE